MNSLIALPTTAPQTTGHPLSLPADHARVAVTKTVQPVDKGSGLDAGRDRGFAQQTRRPKQGSDEKTAPPTIMQMKIETMLMEQAEKIASEAANAEEPAPAPTPEQSAPKVDADTVEMTPVMAGQTTVPDAVEAPETAAVEARDQEVSDMVDSKDRNSDLSTLP